MKATSREWHPGGVPTNNQSLMLEVCQRYLSDSVGNGMVASDNIIQVFLCVYKFNCSFRNRIHQAAVDDVKIGSVEGQASCSNERYLFP